MGLANYTDLTTAIGTWLQRSDITAQFPTFVQLFEACANRRLRTRWQEAVAILTPQAVVTITGAAAAPSTGLVRLALTATTALSSSDQVSNTGILGTTEANGQFQISVVDGTHVDLIGQLFSNAYASGGTLTDTGNVPLPGDYLAWRSVTWLGNPNRDLSFVEPAIMTSRFPNLPVDLPSEFSIEGSTLRVMPQDPTPLKFLYYQQIPSLQTNSTNWLMTAHPDIYLFGALTEAQAYAVNVETAALWKARRDELFDEIEKLSNKTRGPAAVRPVGPTP
jgi:hypothetical protein